MKLFISDYQHDGLKLDAFVVRLAALGYEIERDKAAISSCGGFILVVTPAMLHSAVELDFLTAIHRLERPIVVIMVDSVNSQNLPFFLLAYPRLLYESFVVENWVFLRLYFAILNRHFPLSLAPLLKALRDTEVYIRQIAAAALGQLGDAAALPALMMALGDEDGLVR